MNHSLQLWCLEKRNRHNRTVKFLNKEPCVTVFILKNNKHSLKIYNILINFLHIVHGKEWNKTGMGEEN